MHLSSYALKRLERVYALCREEFTCCIEIGPKIMRFWDPSWVEVGFSFAKQLRNLIILNPQRSKLLIYILQVLQP